MRLLVDALVCRLAPWLARYTIDARLPSGGIYHMNSVALRSARNAAVLSLRFRTEAEGLLPPEDCPQYRPRRL